MARIGLWFCWIPQDEKTEEGWKLHDVRLPEYDTDLNWFVSIEEATNRWHCDSNLVRLQFLFLYEV
jgi:hypothetical protein